jgi:hypothetical protein
MKLLKSAERVVESSSLRMRMMRFWGVLVEEGTTTS